MSVVEGLTRGASYSIMGNFIPENIIEDILGRIDIVELISSCFPLRKAGRNFKALCPFHKEKTPSFIVSQDKQIFHCFGCQEGGNAFHFLMKYEHLDFPEAIRLLAKRAGVVIPQTEKDNREPPGIFKINDLALQFYRGTLLNSPSAQAARRYLQRRSLNEEIMDKFKLGFAPQDGAALVNFLRDKGISLDSARKSGLIVRRKTGEGFFDFFRRRVIYPIFDLRLRVLGFGGRVLDDSLPKYINIPETPVYKKGEILYGLNFSRDAVRRLGFTIIVEGYMDLLSLFQEGFQNVVATLGTALTAEHVRLIKRFSPSVVVLYDADKAGELAALRGLEFLLEEGLDVKLVALPEGFDPDKFIRLKGKAEFEKKLQNAQNLFEYKLNLLSRQYNLSHLEGKLKVIKEMLPTINKVNNMVLRAEFVKQFAEALSVSEEAVWIELKKVSRSASSYKNENSSKKGESSEPMLFCSSTREAEVMLLKLMLEERSFIKKVKQNLNGGDFLNPQVRKVVEILYTIDEENSHMEPSRLVNYLNSGPENQVVTNLLMADVFGDNSDLVFEDCIKKIKEDNRRRTCQRLKDEMICAQDKGDAPRLEELLNQFNSLIRKKRNRE